MAATEDISLRIALDDRQAQAGLDALRQETAGLAQSAEGAAGGIGAITTKVDRAKAVIEPTATAVNGMASAFGGLNTQTGAVLGGVSNLASAFMAGGPLALGLVAIGTGVSWLTTKYQESTKAAQEAEKAQKEAALKTAKVIDGLTKSIEDQIASTAGYNQAELALGRLRKQYEDTEARLESLKQTTKEQFSFDVLRAGQVKTLKEGEELHAQKLEETAQAYEALGIELNNAIVSSEAYDKKTRELAAVQRVYSKEDEKIVESLKAKTVATKEQVDADFDAMQAVKDLFAAEIKARKEAEAEARRIWEETGPTREMFDREQMRQAGEMEKARVDAAKKAAEERIKIEEEVARRTEEINNKTANISVEIATGAVGLLTGAANEIFTGIMSGREDVVQMATANFLSGLGSQLVGIGTKALIEGAIISANPLTPGAGAPMMALGGLAVAAGIGMGGVGAAISSSIGSTTAPAGGGAATTTTPMGAGRISTGGAGQRDGGGMEQVTYVFNAPVFGDQNRSARHVAMLQRRGQRDLLLA